jgi:hypothetical protein
VLLFLLTLHTALQASPDPHPPRIIQIGRFQSQRVSESSGVAASRTHRGVLWTHNDSGDGPYVYATDLTGADRAVVRVDGARAVDWEDVALAPCPTGPDDCLYIADTGDNEERRKSVVVYVVPEPHPPVRVADTTRAVPVATIRLKYPDGPHDVEAIYVSQADSALYLVSKGRRGSVRLYRLGRHLWLADSVVTAALVQDLPITSAATYGGLVTGAAIRADGRAVAIRTYSDVYFFVPGARGRLAPGLPPACSVAGLEVQGEGVSFLDDSTLVLTSEGVAGSAGTIHTVRCPL